MTLYALQPAPGTGSLDDAAVMGKLRHGWQFLEQAISLWRLVDEHRAGEIEATMDRVAQRAPDAELRFEAEDVADLVRLLSGVEDAIVAAGIVDHNWIVPVSRIEELARRVPAMDLTTERSLENKRYALGEVMNNAVSLRDFLENAAREGLVVVLG